MAGSMLEAVDHDLHKMRRGAANNFFSKRSVQSLEPLIVRSVDTLIERLKTESGDKVVNLNNAYAAMAMDIICAYCFGTNMDSLSNPVYGKEWLDMLHSGIQMRPVGRQFPWLVNTIFDTPPHIVEKFSEDMARANRWTRQMMPRIEAILAGEDAATDQRTIFHDMRDGDLSPEEKAPMRLMSESHVFLGAGTETTARTLAVTTFYLMKDNNVGDKLREELRGVMPTPNSGVSLSQLEALPYLVSVVAQFWSKILTLLVCGHQRRLTCRSRSLISPTSHRAARRPCLQTMDHSSWHTRNAIRLPPSYRPQRLPRSPFL
jgi:cytochrome P450